MGLGIPVIPNLSTRCLDQENKIKILIRRAGPNYLEGLRKVKAASDKLGLGIKVGCRVSKSPAFWILFVESFLFSKSSWSHLDISWHSWTRSDMWVVSSQFAFFLRKVYGPETHITAIIPMALGLVEPLPEPDLSAPAGPPAWTWEHQKLSISFYLSLSQSISIIIPDVPQN